MRTKSFTTPPSASTRHRPPLIRPLVRSFLRQTSRSPANGSGSAKPVSCANALIVGAPRPVHADQHLVGRQDLGGVDGGAADDPALAVGIRP